uniref:Uncharacterized protein n=1 Tax=Poecilia latipinna TaxID=48699 RepID=A0A3B3VHN0_9TELE
LEPSHHHLLVLVVIQCGQMYLVNKDLSYTIVNCTLSHSSAPQNLNDLRGTLQEEWDAIPQHTISPLVNSARRCQGVIDVEGHMTCYRDFFVVVA